MRIRKPTPEKYCAHCGKKLERRKINSTLEDLAALRKRVFCNRACMAENMMGKIKVPVPKNFRRQSARKVEKCCSICSKSTTRLHVHHIDFNPTNNEESNLVTLCGSCHRLAHSPIRMEMGRQAKPCKHCNKPCARLGLCCTHLTRYKKYGNPLATRVKHGSKWVLILENG